MKPFTINWILQKNLTKPSVCSAIKAALNGVDEIYEEVNVIPFSTEMPEIAKKDSFNVIYGSTTFMFNAFRHNDFKQGVFFDPIKFQMANYVDQWKNSVLNADGQLLKFGEIQNLASTETKKWFVRPNSDGKSFSGKVMTFRELKTWSERVCQLAIPELNEDTEIWIAEPKNIIKEWRLFIVDDQIISAARYMNQGKLDEDENDLPIEMLHFAKERIAEYRLEDIYAMDIAETANGYKLIECNCFNGTGFYRHNIKKIVQAINRFLKKHN